MPSSKTHRNQLNKYKVNLSVKTAIKSSITKLKESIESDNAEETEKLYRETSKVLDRAAKKKVIHKNNASRKKSRLQQLINKKK
ncbi:MAG: 30S ribosomal protein S20 [SAR202 cluster bacterium]|jgi:small subunit ribosomal protein S20|nr:MAG: 30S ribosomal protein S20 [SAR202 cluster bacterium]KAA1298851.1 MAG: 30S ribosomal protein S20 [SAR202 cluster bacterium]MQG12166.1 30S ribosomal protein S20 [SAR202 cluster bacterium]RZP15102.1 MAG: 30S ribosomal protein S20 [Chloroflexota bacterium]|tara:strand:+ start:489 stop:740 length:252 start_codon:yes stop_codon:yes gene_type:complete